MAEKTPYFCLQTSVRDNRKTTPSFYAQALKNGWLNKENFNQVKGQNEPSSSRIAKNQHHSYFQVRKTKK